MTELIKVALIAAGAGIVTSIGPTISAIAAWRASKGVHVLMNSRFTEWKEETKAANVAAVIAAYEKGKSDEKEKTEPKVNQP